MSARIFQLLSPGLKPIMMCLLALAILPLHAQTLTQRWSKLITDKTYVNTQGEMAKTGPDGNLVVASNAGGVYYSQSDDVLINKFDGSTGAQLWQQRSNSPTGFGDFAADLVIDGEGNIIVVGQRIDLRSGVDPMFFAAKYKGTDGTLLWQRAFQVNYEDYFTCVAVDARNDVILAGTTVLAGVSPVPSDIMVFKFASATGETLWQSQYSSIVPTKTTTDGAKALALDAQGDVYVTGYGYYNRDASRETITLKLAGSDGKVLWNHLRTDSNTGGSTGEDIAVDASGNVIIACSTTQGSRGYRVVKYQGTNGTELWVNFFYIFGFNFPNSLGIDPAGNVVVTGYTNTTATGDDILTQKISGSDGSTLWTRTYDGGNTNTKGDRGAAIRFDPTGNPVVAGYSDNASSTGPDTMILKYASATGATLIQQRIAVSAGEDAPSGRDSLDVSPGQISVVGRSYVSGKYQAFILRLNAPANPVVTTRAATSVGSTTAQVGASVNPNGSATNLRYVYGTSAAALNQSTADKAMGNGFAGVESQDTLTGLQPSTTYFYQARAIGNSQTVQGQTFQFTTPSNNANLASLSVSAGALNPSFSPSTTGYSITLPPTATVMSVTPTAAHPAATLRVNGTQLASGVSSAPVPLPFGNTAIDTVVTAEDTTITRTYSVTVTRVPEKFIFSSATDVPVRAPGFTANGLTADLVFNFAPPTGTNLTVVDNTGVAFIAGRFSNLAQGQEIILHYGAASYPYMVNYYGGDGNDLVLTWAHQRVYAWGYNNAGQLGLGTTTNANIPTAIRATSPLSGKTILSLAAGYSHSLALCADGSLFAWGSNAKGQLGDGTSANSTVPVDITRSGVLTGKRVISISAGLEQSFALCSDGTLAAWGGNTWGLLGDGTSTNRAVPVAVVSTGFLTGKQIVSISSGQWFSLALCADGSIAGWGNNIYGQLGSTAPGTTTTPVEVTRNGALLGGQVMSAVAGSDGFGIFRCSDGTAAGTGWNNMGQLGNGNTSNAATPVRVVTSGVLSGKSLRMISPGNHHCVALASDGTAVAWGENILGTLGNNSTSNSSSPVAVQANGLLAGKTITSVNGNYFNSAAFCSDGTVAIWGYGGSGALGNGSTTTSNVPVAAKPPAAGEKFSSLSQGSSAAHFMAIAAVPLSDDSSLASLALSTGSLQPAFSSGTTRYATTVPSGLASLTVTPATSHAYATATVNGLPVSRGAASAPVAILPGENLLSIVVTAETGATTTYTVTVNRPPLIASFDSASAVATTVADYSARGNTVELSLHFPPPPGTVLTVINVTDPAFIDGQFANLAQGQHVGLTSAGVTYDFVANYFGGTGNDLVLQWANTKLFAWGSNSYGQLGDDSTTRKLVPVTVNDTVVLAGKTLTAVAGGYLHSLALCSDGTLAAWGYNVYGQLGNNSIAPSPAPIAIDRSGVLAGKTVIAISAGPFHNLALCSDGSIAAWGYNNYGQLGTGDKQTSRVPVSVKAVGALAGRQLVAVAAGAYSSFALCADGSLVAWGYNDEGELGDGTTVTSQLPVAVTTSGILAGKKIASISAGQYHTLALCTDGTLASWGYNKNGQLGNNTTVSSKVPVAIGSFGALAGKTVKSIRAGKSHSLALCADGSVVSWGFNAQGQLGAGAGDQKTIPTTVNLADVTGGRTISNIAVGGNHSLGLLSDGTQVAWGDNSEGQLGNNSATPSIVPVVVDGNSLGPGSRVMFEATGSASLHNLSIVGIPSPNNGRIQGIAGLGTASEENLLDDSDRDGIPNLVEYAFGLDPTNNSAGQLPQWKSSDDGHTISFTEPAGLKGMIYGAEWSPSMIPGSWQEIQDTGTGADHIFSVPSAGHSNAFMRLKVTRRQSQ